MATSSAVKYALKNGVAVLQITSPPVNALGAAVRAGLVAGVEHAIGASATGLVVAGGGSTFPAGADITEFAQGRDGKAFAEPDLVDVCSALEQSSLPTVAAIHGTALGGGLETALACHYRVASPRARVGHAACGVRCAVMGDAAMLEAALERDVYSLSADGAAAARGRVQDADGAARRGAFRPRRGRGAGAAGP